MNALLDKYPELELDSIAKVHKAISPYTIKTPLILSREFSDLLGKKIYFKLENLQVTGTFKLRGAINKVLKSARGKKGTNGIITVSNNGNHGIAVSYAGHKLGIKTVIVMPEGVSEEKIQACKDLGAKVITKGEEFKKAYDLSLEIMNIHDLIYIHPFEDLDIISANGSIALEIFKDCPQVDNVICSMSNRSLISGVSNTIKKIKREVNICGVEITDMSSIYENFKKEKTEELIISNVNSNYAVSNEEIKNTMSLLLDKQKILVNSVSACAFAAILEGRVPLGENNVIIFGEGG